MRRGAQSWRDHARKWISPAGWDVEYVPYVCRVTVSRRKKMGCTPALGLVAAVLWLVAAVLWYADFRGVTKYHSRLFSPGTAVEGPICAL